MSEPKNVILLGDSITQGLGSRQINFSHDLQENLGRLYEVTNLAYTGTTIDYPLALMETEPKLGSGSICVILYGNVDAQIRPSRTGKVFPKIPNRYKHNGMLSPRPFYSHSFMKRVGQYADNLFRKMLSSLIITVDGTEQWVSASDFESQYRELVTKNLLRGNACVCCSTVFIDERYFKGSRAEYERFNTIIECISNEQGCPYLDIYGLLKGAVEEEGWDGVYNLDHFHPKGRGYQIMADAIANEVRRFNESTLPLAAMKTHGYKE